MADAPISPAVFAEAVERTLLPIIGPLGFKMVETTPYRVQFRHRLVVVSVSYDPRGELAVDVARDEDDEPPLGLSSVLKACGVPETILWQANLMTTDADAMARLLGRAADLLHQHAQGFLEGDDELFAEAYAERRARSHEYTRRVAVSSRTIDEADTAWQEHDYERVRALLSPVRDRLDQAHLRRLEYAERR